MLNQGNNTFLTPTTLLAGDRPVAIANADFNGDGVDDVAVVNGIDPRTSTATTPSRSCSASARSFRPADGIRCRRRSIRRNHRKGKRLSEYFRAKPSRRHRETPTIPWLPFCKATAAEHFLPPLLFFPPAPPCTCRLWRSPRGTSIRRDIPPWQSAIATAQSTSSAIAAARLCPPQRRHVVGQRRAALRLELVLTRRRRRGWRWQYGSRRHAARRLRLQLPGQNALTGGAVIIWRGNGDGTFQAPVYLTSTEPNSDPSFVTLGSLTGAALPSMVVVDGAGPECQVAYSEGPYPILFTNNGGLSFTETDFEPSPWMFPVPADPRLAFRGARGRQWRRRERHRSLRSRHRDRLAQQRQRRIQRHFAHATVLRREFGYRSVDGGSFFGPGVHESASPASLARCSSKASPAPRQAPAQSPPPSPSLSRRPVRSLRYHRDSDGTVTACGRVARRARHFHRRLRGAVSLGTVPPSPASPRCPPAASRSARTSSPPVTRTPRTNSLPATQGHICSRCCH